MSTHMSEFQSFLNCFLHHFVFAKLATTSIGVKSLREQKKRILALFPNEIEDDLEEYMYIHDALKEKDFS